MTEGFVPLTRRALLGPAAAALAVSVVPRRAARAQAAATPIAPIQRLDATLLAAMKLGPQAPFMQRYKLLEPTIEQTFDLPLILAESVGFAWSTLPAAKKAELLAAFRRYTVSSYAANFTSFSGQRFEISPDLRHLGNGEVIVQTTIVPVHGAANKLDYVMRNGGGGWRAVDVLADGTISRVAVQRSDFRDLLASGGVAALVAGLRRKVANLSNGMLA